VPERLQQPTFTEPNPGSVSLTTRSDVANDTSSQAKAGLSCAFRDGRSGREGETSEALIARLAAPRGREAAQPTPRLPAPLVVWDHDYGGEA